MLSIRETKMGKVVVLPPSTSSLVYYKPIGTIKCCICSSKIYKRYKGEAALTTALVRKQLYKEVIPGKLYDK